MNELDLNNDEELTLSDVGIWRRIAATRNGLSGPYPIGDADLNGIVNALDLNALAISWQQDGGLWSGGDFNASGFVDVLDLNELAIRWRQRVPPANAVPEPQALFLLLSATIAVLASRRR